MGPDAGQLIIRDAAPGDGVACAAIYAPYVTGTTITFELQPPTAQELAHRIATAQEHWAWLVAECDGHVCGYAYAGRFHPRAAYRWACEVSVYLELGRRRTGTGRALYEALFERLIQRGFRTAIACMTLPNEASAGLHTAMGFEPVGTFHAIGYKLGSWQDVQWSERELQPVDDPPADPA